MSYSLGGYASTFTDSVSPVAVSVSVTVSSVGSLLVVFASYCSGSVTSVTGAGITWSQGSQSSGPFGAATWYGITTATGPQTITVNSLGAYNGAGFGPAWAGFAVQEFIASGADTAWLDTGSVWGYGNMVISDPSVVVTPYDTDSVGGGLPCSWYWVGDVTCLSATWTCGSWLCAIAAASFVYTGTTWTLVADNANQYPSGTWTGVTSGVLPSLCPSANHIVMVI